MNQAPPPLQVATYLAVGLVKQHEQTIQRQAPPITNPNSFLKTGLEQLAVLCLWKGIRPPCYHKQVVEWLHTPVEDWPEPISTSLTQEGLEGPLLFLGTPTDLAYDLIHQLGETNTDTQINIEIQDLPFKQILRYCREKQLADQYVQARLFLVENPYLPTGTHVIQSNLNWDNEVGKLLAACYQPIPISCRFPRNNQNQVAFCPRCGWVLEWQLSAYTQVAHCYSDICSRLNERISQPNQWELYQPEAMRTTQSTQKSIVAPERPLLDLKAQLEKIGATCHLWPQFDNYDLLVKLPSGKPFAVDMKDYSCSVKLVNVLKPFARTPSWDRCYYVIPDYRKQGNYWKKLKATWDKQCKADPSLKTIGVLFAKDFIKLVRKEIGGKK